MIEFMITSSILIGAIILLRFVARNRVSAMMRYATWLLVLARLILPTGLPESPFSVMNMFASQPAQIQYTSLDAPVSYPQREQEPIAPVLPESLPGNEATPLQQQQAAQPATSAPPVVPLGVVLIWIWGIGAAMIGVWFFFINLRFYRKIKRAAVLLPKAQMKYPVYLVEALSTPCIMGIGRPAVYLPAYIAGDERATRHSITHELCHYFHGDHIWAWVRIVCVSIYWFHPLVWVAAVLSKQDCELACDAAVIKKLGETERIAYGNTLLRLASVSPARDRLLCAATTMHTGKARLRERIVHISKPYRMGVLSAFLMSAICTLLVSCTMTSSITASDVPPVITLEQKPSETPDSDQLPTPSQAPLPYATLQGELLAAFETIYMQSKDDEQLQNRCYNIEKAAGLLDKLVVLPGETFSFNEVVGPRTAEDGWKSASAVVNNASYANIPGGGIDQVSTTLYNALLLANLPVTERRAHSTPSSYVEKGLDATVDNGNIDLKFLNDTQVPVYLRASILEDAENGRRVKLQIEVYGTPFSANTEYRLRSVLTNEEAAPKEIRYEDDATLPLGMEETIVLERNGYEVEIYRDTYQNGALIDTQLLYIDNYRSSPRIVRRGTKAS